MILSVDQDAIEFYRHRFFAVDILIFLNWIHTPPSFLEIPYIITCILEILPHFEDVLTILIMILT